MCRFSSLARSWVYIEPIEVDCIESVDLSMVLFFTLVSIIDIKGVYAYLIPI